MTLDHETYNFAVKAVIVLFVVFGASLAPAAGLVMFTRVAIRLASPYIEGELLKSQSFIDRISGLVEHKVANGQAKLLGAYEILIEKFALVEKMADAFTQMQKDIAVLKDRSEHK